jgi:hypothetical protein
MSKDIPASELAAELNVPVAELLARADKIIGEIVERDGLDKARGFTTRTVQHAQNATVVISPSLADALRWRRRG